MRLVVFFDLPTLTGEDRRAYRKFRKLLIKSGFMMMQESVYCKLLQNNTAAAAICDTLRKQKPSKGLIQILQVTEKQYNKMEFLVGAKESDVLDTDERIVVL